MVRIISALLLAISAFAASADTVQLAENAPDSYTVVKGDTLWDISGRFLKHPWRWPEVWRLNRDQIRNPHLIYPGQVVYLDRTGPSLSLSAPGGGGAGGTVKLSPKVHEEAISPIPSVPLSAIEPFLSQPLIVSEGDIVQHGTIVATQEGRLLVGPGDTFFAKGIRAGVADWQVYRRATPLTDPVTKELLGYEALYLGSARVSEEGSPAALQVLSVEREINPGDRLIPFGKQEMMSFVPRAPASPVAGRIVKIHDSLYHTGKYSVVAVNTGRNRGIEPGHVLAIYRTRPDAAYNLDGKKETFTLPEERIGLLFVFRVFEKAAYALVVESSGPVKVTDAVRQP